jgi:hypothetical protein
MYFLSTCVIFVYGDFVWYYHDFLPDTTVVPPRMNRPIALCFPGQHLISMLNELGDRWLFALLLLGELLTITASIFLFHNCNTIKGKHYLSDNMHRHKNVAGLNR